MSASRHNLLSMQKDGPMGLRYARRRGVVVKGLRNGAAAVFGLFGMALLIAADALIVREP